MSHQQSSHEITPDSEIQDEIIDNQAEVNAAETQPAAEAPAEVNTQNPTGDPASEIEALRLSLAEAQQQAAANLDRALRVQADMENLKKRVQKDLDDERKYGISKFAKELLSVLDSLELGLQAVGGDSQEVIKFKEGSELTLKQFAAVFAKFNIETLDPTGQPFNPELHQAMAMQPSAEYPAGSVIATFQKGYLIHGRLLRPAMVVVAKAAETTNNDEQA